MPVRPFSLLARVYDAIMDDIAYDDWAEFILGTITAAGWQGRRVLDLGCGTGNSSAPFLARGYEVIGLDASAEMLQVAREKLPPVTFIQADFTTFALGERFDLAVSVFDALNNLLEPTAFLAAARRVHAHLRPGGRFMFDVNTTVGLRDLWESGRAEGWAGGVYYCWEHSFDEASGLAKVEAACEVDEQAFTEVHYERPYDPPEIRALLGAAGFEDIRVLSYPSGAAAGPDEERVWAVAKRREWRDGA